MVKTFNEYITISLYENFSKECQRCQSRSCLLRKVNTSKQFKEVNVPKFPLKIIFFVEKNLMLLQLKKTFNQYS